jgi:hypothetical protein
LQAKVPKIITTTHKNTNNFFILLQLVYNINYFLVKC